VANCSCCQPEVQFVNKSGYFCKSNEISHANNLSSETDGKNYGIPDWHYTMSPPPSLPSHGSKPL
jgi:hypothetical protein